MDADAGVGDAKLKLACILLLATHDPHDDLALAGELHGIADEVGHDLAEADFVAEEPVGYVVVDHRAHGDPAFGGLCRHQADDALQSCAELEGSLDEVELARLDLREVQAVIEQTQQHVGRLAHNAQGVALLLVERRVEHEVQHADDAVHGGADLVAHVGEELALGNVRGPRLAREVVGEG